MRSQKNAWDRSWVSAHRGRLTHIGGKRGKGIGSKGQKWQWSVPALGNGTYQSLLPASASVRVCPALPRMKDPPRRRAAHLCLVHDPARLPRAHLTQPRLGAAAGPRGAPAPPVFPCELFMAVTGPAKI